MDILDRFERRFGRFAIPNLLAYVALGQAVAWMLIKARPEASAILEFDRGLMLRGDAWRLLSWVFLPPASDPFSAFFGIYFLWFMGSALDRAWGSFRLNVFYLLGVAFNVGLGLLLPWASVSPGILHLTVFLAFALEFPDFEVLLFFILPVKVKWLAWLDGLALLATLVLGGWSSRLLVLASSLNFALFFAPMLLRRIRQQHAVAGFQADFHRSKAIAAKAQAKVCCVCSATAEAADIRLCHCEACPPDGRFYCMEHLGPHLAPAPAKAVPAVKKRGSKQA